MKVIYFYEPDEPNGFLGNFYPSPINMKGVIWPTSEHYYQAQKVSGTELAEKIRTMPSPGEAFDYSRTEGFPQRADWYEVRDDVMREVVYAKFTQHPDLKKMLLDTGDDTLVEQSPIDSYWGIGADGKGRNTLGKILMEVRDRIRKEESGVD